MKEQPESASYGDNDGPNAAVEPAEESGSRARQARPAPQPDPTRYGDWEKNGRCIDF